MIRALLAGLVMFGTLSCKSTPVEVRVEFYNHSAVDLTLFATSSDAILAELAPGESDVVDIDEIRWIDFGMMAHEYRFPSSLPSDFVQAGIARMQADSQGRLCLLPLGAAFPAPQCPEQPEGFPLEPVSITDLT